MYMLLPLHPADRPTAAAATATDRLFTVCSIIIVVGGEQAM